MDRDDDRDDMIDDLMRKNVFIRQQTSIPQVQQNQRREIDFDDREGDLKESISISSVHKNPISNSQNNQNVLSCTCGQQFTDKQQILHHPQICKIMQQEGYLSFIKIIENILDVPPGNSKSQILAQRQQNLRAIFENLQSKNEIYGQQDQIMPGQYPRFSVLSNSKFEEEKKQNKDIEMIDQFDQINSFGRNQIQQPSNVCDARNMEQYMSEKEKQQAENYYLQIQREKEDSLCKFCDNIITNSDEKQNNATMIQSTDCFHRVHISCLIKNSVEKLSSYQVVQCPKCFNQIQDFELRSYFSPEITQKIEKSQQMQIVKSNPNLVQCSCDNIMDFVPGEIIKGQKDERGNLLTAEAANHMAKNRIRCDQCQKNFCISCSAEPYHVGRTCNQVKLKSCRYCLEDLKQPSPSMKPAFKDVCRKQECINLMQSTCEKVLPCGHPCCGFSGEKKCMPCLDPKCIDKMDPSKKINQNIDDYCTVCQCSGLGQEPCVHLDCGHIFHLGCVKTQVQKKWNGARIVFNYLNCPACKTLISSKNCQELQLIVDQESQLKQKITKMAIERAKFEDLYKDEKFKKEPYLGKNMEEYALKNLSYYQCFKCSNPYFGGKKECGVGQDYENFKKEELVCGKCAAVAVGGGIKECPKHGQDFIEFKCKFCCQIAQWFCWGNTHFCEPCHKRQCAGDYVSRKTKDQLPRCEGPKKCPIGGNHPANGDEYALGCSVCRNVKENQKDF